MNLKLNQVAFTIPVFCKDQAADIRIIETAANKALQNIYSVYNDIMTPQANNDVECEASVSDYSSDSTSCLIGNKSGVNSNSGVPKLLPEKLCSKCKKLVSLCSTCRKHDSCNPLRIHPHIETNKHSLQDRSNSFPQVKSLYKSSFHHPEQEDIDCIKQHSPKNTLCGTKVSKNESCYPEKVKKDSFFPEKVQRNSLHGIDQNSDGDFCLLGNKSSGYSESISLTNTECDDCPNYSFKSVKKTNIQFNITVPKPFSLSAKNVKRLQAKEEKISKLREQINSQIEKEIKVKISSKPVPKHVYLPLYGEMVQMNEKRKKERKEKCIEMLNKKIKPFNLSSNVSKSRSVSNLSKEGSKTFKAKPVPKNILRENVSQKVKNKEEIRKLLIAQRAEDMLKKSSLPFSAKPVQRSHSLFNISDTTSKSNLNVTKEKIDAITKRLYSIKCQETIENWNNKVLQNDLWDKETSNAKNKCPKKSNDDIDKDKKIIKSALPFYNFPVRMTTASYLREKQIRSDIEMRERRKETDENMRDEIAHKRKEVLKNILSRLKSMNQMYDIGKGIEEKVKSYRESQKSRNQEYEKELEDMMNRVSKQFLLIERQSKDLKEKLVHSTKSEDELSSYEAENDSSKEVKSPASLSMKSDSPIPPASKKSNSLTSSASEKSDSPTSSASE